jgi:hypothetical protein
MDEVSRQLTELTDADAAAGHSLVDAVAALYKAIEFAARVNALCQQHGELFREFLDTL